MKQMFLSAVIWFNPVFSGGATLVAFAHQRKLQKDKFPSISLARPPLTSLPAIGSNSYRNNRTHIHLVFKHISRISVRMTWSRKGVYSKRHCVLGIESQTECRRRGLVEGIANIPPITMKNGPSSRRAFILLQMYFFPPSALHFLFISLGLFSTVFSAANVRWYNQPENTLQTIFNDSYFASESKKNQVNVTNRTKNNARLYILNKTCANI